MTVVSSSETEISGCANAAKQNARMQTAMAGIRSQIEANAVEDVVIGSKILTSAGKHSKFYGA